ncbi:hypothetical protein [Prosthecomicrobium hirschii]|uniref:hypothetical protein n=1 Tax=Prosthecodimorpha hirschii TaxID=665126 RepID=UPI00221F17D7|nr:hypothetical protein [Prosthecomicrobium hirschii]MCW1838989.1 hypothetical protein [Prosthecomicrobium hirschii]
MSEIDATLLSPAEAARALFAADGLAFPPLPDALAARLVRDADETTVFSTRADLPASPYQIEVYTRELARGRAPSDYALIGFAGHGINSWAAHYYRVMPGLALLIQIEWGGAYTDAEMSKALAERLFAWAARMQDKAAAAREAGTLPFEKTLLFVFSPFGTSGWAWLDGAAPTDRVTLDTEAPIGSRAEAAFDAASTVRR